MPEQVRASRRKYHIIYKTTCLVTGRYYIGMHSTDDLEDGYKGSGQRLWKSIKKYGEDQHVCIILEHHPDRESLSKREEELVNRDLLQDPLCMNLRTGGTGNYLPTTSEETRRKLSERGKVAWAEGRHTGMLGKKASEKTIAKRVQKLKGQTRTPEQRANLSSGLKQYNQAVDPAVLQERAQRAAKTRAERGTNLGGRPKGIPMSEEQKARQSAATRGKKLSAQHRQNLRKPKSRISCVFCRKETTTSHLPRYHAFCT